ncbi:MAG: hypothetical protein KTR29_10910 [Rhodothermaceae bacterium]|nr:hypothetical protein [Rhodothermaceae bacterium]
MKKGLKVLRYIVVLFLIVELAHLLVLLFPQPFFRHSVSIHNAQFYSDTPLEESEITLFRTAIEQASLNPLFDSTQKHRIFISASERTYSLYSRLAGKTGSSQGFNIEPTGNVFISRPFIDTMRSQYGAAFQYTLLEGSLSHVILHEIYHSMVTNHLGFWESRNLPSWKREGYVEYGASWANRKSDPAFDLRSHIDLLYDQSAMSSIRLHYLRSQLLVQYLIDIEGMTFKSLMTEEVDEGEALLRMIRWKQEGEL